ncbi:MAG TPA: hypothetical protein VNT56_00005 [Acidimicrobiales bacterium]|nr:hypothetical protein [Acidimicrobiales bacterium]
MFNLGWGVPPETDPDALARVVELVHAASPPAAPAPPRSGGRERANQASPDHQNGAVPELRVGRRRGPAPPPGPVRRDRSREELPSRG